MIYTKVSHLLLSNAKNKKEKRNLMPRIARWLLYTMMLLAAVIPLAASGVATPSSPIRALCRGGQPPFVYLLTDPSTNASTCKGILNDLFLLAVQRSGLNYTLTVNPTANTDSAIAISVNTNTSQQDVAIAFTTVTPQRLQVMDFTVSMYAVDYSMVVSSSFAKGSSSLADVVVRPAVWYIFGIVAIVIQILTTCYFVLESFTVPGSAMLNEPTYSGRLLLAFEAGFETVLCTSCSLELSSRISRALRTLGGVAGLFLVAMLGAVITSKLTSSSLQATTPSLGDMRNQRVAASGAALTPFLKSQGIDVVVVSDVQTAAIQFHQGGNPLNLAGYSTTTPVAQWLQQQYDTSGTSAVSSSFFLSSGTTEVKALPVSRALDVATAVAFNVAMQQLRDDGTVSSAIQSAINAPQTPSADDIPLNGNQMRDVTIGALSLCGIVGAAYAMLALLDIVLACRKNAAAGPCGSSLNAVARRDGGDEAVAGENGNPLELMSDLSSLHKVEPKVPQLEVGRRRKVFSFCQQHIALQQALESAGVIEEVQWDVHEQKENTRIVM